MKKNSIRILVLGLVMSCITVSSFGQLGDIGNLLAGGISDGEKLMKAYLKPLGNAMGANLSSGWYSTAKTHKLGGVDITFNMNLALIPSADKSFQLSSLALSNGATGTAPTFSGSRDKGPLMTYMAPAPNNTYQLAQYNTPPGTGLSFLPSPMLQLGVGLIKDTELTGRFVPSISVGKIGNFGLWGIGIKHGLKQWIPVINRVPFLNLTVQAGYTSMSQSANVKVTPDMIGSVDQTTAQAANWNGQKMDLKVTNFTANLLVSVDIPVISLYGGVGISSSKTNLGMLGKYPVPTFGSTSQPSVVTDASLVTDPFHISIGSKDGSITKPRLNAGLLFKLAVLHIHFDYTYANYSVATAGIGLSFR